MGGLGSRHSSAPDSTKDNVLNINLEAGNITYPFLNAGSLKLCKKCKVLGGEKQEHATEFKHSLQTVSLD